MTSSVGLSRIECREMKPRGIRRQGPGGVSREQLVDLRGYSGGLDPFRTLPTLPEAPGVTFSLLMLGRKTPGPGLAAATDTFLLIWSRRCS